MNKEMRFRVHSGNYQKVIERCQSRIKNGDLVPDHLQAALYRISILVWPGSDSIQQIQEIADYFIEYDKHRDTLGIWEKEQGKGALSYWVTSIPKLAETPNAVFPEIHKPFSDWDKIRRGLSKMPWGWQGRVDWIWVKIKKA